MVGGQKPPYLNHLHPGAQKITDTPATSPFAARLPWQAGRSWQCCMHCAGAKDQEKGSFCPSKTAAPCPGRQFLFWMAWLGGKMEEDGRIEESVFLHLLIFSSISSIFLLQDGSTTRSKLGFAQNPPPNPRVLAQGHAELSARRRGQVEKPL